MKALADSAGEERERESCFSAIDYSFPLPLGAWERLRHCAFYILLNLMTVDSLNPDTHDETFV